MDDTYTPPFAKYGMKAPGDAQEAPAPPTPEAAAPDTPQDTTAAPAAAKPSAPSPEYVPPWQKYGMTDPLDPQPLRDTTEDTARAFEAEFIKKTANPSEPTLNWFQQVGRAAFFDVGDLLTAKLVQDRLAEDFPDLTYAQTLRMVRGTLEAEQSTSAEVVGFLAPGLGVAKGVMGAGRAVLATASKVGLTKGAMRWAMRNPKLANVAKVAAEGAGGGAAFEAIRSSTEQAISGAAGNGVDPGEIADAILVGGLVGGLMAPPVQGAMRVAGAGIAAASGFIGRSLGVSTMQSTQATRLILKAARQPGEVAEDTLERLRGDVATFTATSKRAPALAEILPAEQVEDIAGIMRQYTGLSQWAREVTDKQIGVAVDSFESMLNSGAKLKDTSTIRYQANRMFGSIMRREGRTPVEVPDDALEVLARNKDWLEQQVKAGNPAAREIKRVVEARDGIKKLRTGFRALTGGQNVAGLRVEVAEMNEELARLIKEQVESGVVDPSEITALKVLARYQGAVANRLAAAERKGAANIKVDEYAPILRGAEQVLERYERDGLKVQLSNANMLRGTASSHAFTETDAAKKDIARAINKAVSSIGTAEVPLYGKVVGAYSSAMTRLESQAAGRAAVRGTESPENLGVLVNKGLTPEGKAIAAARQPAVRKGTAEGVRLDLRDAAQGSRQEVARATGKIRDSERIQESIRAVAPKEADEIISRAVQTSKSIEGLEALAAVKSVAAMTGEQRSAKMALEGIVANKLGGAALANLGAWLYTRAGIPRGTAVKALEMLADPKQSGKALEYIIRKEVDMAAFLGAVIAESERTSR